MYKRGLMSIVLKRTGMLLCGLLVFSVSSCSNAPKDDVVLRINDYKMTKSEFEKEFKKAGTYPDTPEGRSQFLDNLMTRKLLLQEAQREGLDKKADFLDTIEKFWEQSLLKEVIDNKVKEIAGDIEVKEEEIKAYYDALKAKNPQITATYEEIKDSIRKQVLALKQTRIIDLWIADLHKQSSLKVEKDKIGVK